MLWQWLVIWAGHCQFLPKTRWIYHLSSTVYKCFRFANNKASKISSKISWSLLRFSEAYLKEFINSPKHHFILIWTNDLPETTLSTRDHILPAPRHSLMIMFELLYNCWTPATLSTPEQRVFSFQIMISNLSVWSDFSKLELIANFTWNKDLEM